MPEKISELFHIRNRFLRSAHLERHFQDPSAFSGYVMTDFARSCLARMADGLKPRSGQRACDRQRSRPANGDGEPPGAKLLWLWLNRPFLNQIGFDLELLIRYEIDLCIKGLIAR